MASIFTHKAKKVHFHWENAHIHGKGKTSPKLNWNKLCVEVGAEAEVEDKPGVEVETEAEVEDKRPAQDETQDQEKR